MKLPNELMFLKNRKLRQKESMEPMKGKRCVVSGSTSGVGLEALKQFAIGGADLIMVCRNLDKAETIKNELVSLYNVQIEIVIADFADMNSVRNAAQTILNQYDSIDVLINSAGLHSTTRTLTQDGNEWVFTVNHLSTFLFTQLLLPLLKKSPQGRIIQVNSEGHRFNGLDLNDLTFEKRRYTGLKSYGASKTAQLYTVWKMAKDLAGTNVTINAMHPGGVRTNIGSNNGRLYRWFLHHVTWLFLKDPIISGKALYYLASASELSQTTGKFFNLTIEEIPAKHALDPKLEPLVWQKTLELTHLLKKDVTAHDL